MEDRLECAYFDDVIVDIKPDAYGRCVGKGEMLVQTLAGFFCLRVKEAELGLPTCPKGEVFVKTNMGFGKNLHIPGTFQDEWDRRSLCLYRQFT